MKLNSYLNESELISDWHFKDLDHIVNMKCLKCNKKKTHGSMAIVDYTGEGLCLDCYLERPFPYTYISGEMVT
jgi:hypothetical protein